MRFITRLLSHLGLSAIPTQRQADVPELDHGIQLYHQGKYDQAIGQLTPLADQGDPQAQYYCGLCYYGEGDMGADYQKSFHYHQLAANQGLREAQYALGQYYAAGTGVAQDYAQAFTWYKRAAEQNYVEAIYTVAVFYHMGYAGMCDFEQALNYYRQAAKQGHARAQYTLGLAYWRGEDVPQDRVKAYMWVAISNLTAPNSQTAETLKTIGENLSPEQRLHAETAARHCMNSDDQDCD